MDLSRFFPTSPGDLRGWVSRRTVILLLMAIFIYQGTGIFYKALTLQLVRLRPTAATEKTLPATARPVRPPAGAYAVIPQRNIFGVTTKAVADPQAAALSQQAALPQQDVVLQIDLRGTVAGDDKYSFAIVEEKASKKQQLVKVGDVVSGAKVLRIKRNAIDLLVNNREQTLLVEETVDKPLVPATAGRPAPSPARTAPAAGPIIVNRTEINEQMQDLGSLLSQAQARPYFHLGQPDGFIITNIRPGSLYQRLGIVNGDVIQGVNDQKITTADDVVGLFNALKDSDNISLTVKRRNNPMTLNYQFR